MCVTCKIPLNVAQSPQADRERAFIQSLIDRGDDEAAIKRALVGQYGPTVLALPSDQRLRRSRLPRAAGGRARAAAALLIVLLPRWRRRARAQARGAAPAPALSTRRRAAPGRRPRSASTDRLRYMCSGALTPSRSRQRAIVRLLATHSAMRRDSTARGSAPTTRQSR